MFKTIRDIHEDLKNGVLTSRALTEQCFQTIDQTEPQFSSFLSLRKEAALQAADEIDHRFSAGDDMPVMAGVPIAIKDNMNIRGEVTTCGSQFLKDFVAPFDATVVEKLQQNNAVLVGKLNLDEFAMGSSTENSAFGASKNPWDVSLVPGGSSGGSAVAVSANQVPVSLGSDTGGSIRQPAAFCGVSGLKPTYGRVSRYGLVAFASSLDQIGPFSRYASDMADILNAICGVDVNDSTSSLQKVPDFSSFLKRDIKGMRFAVPKELFGDLIDPGVKQCVSQALDQLTAAGATWEEVSMSSFEAAISTYYLIAPAEASSNLARFDGVRYTSRDTEASSLKAMFEQSRGEGFGKEVKRRILLGTFALSSGYYDAYYLRAQKARTLIKEDFNRVFESYDAIISPTTPTTAFKFGEHTDDPLQMYMADIATIPANMAGLPGISIPCGFSNGLPVGMQLVGKAFDEGTLLNVADTYQYMTDFHLKEPGVE